MMMNDYGINSDDIQWPQSKPWMPSSYLRMPKNIMNNQKFDLTWLKPKERNITHFNLINFSLHLPCLRNHTKWWRMTSEPTWMASKGPKADHDHTCGCPKKFWMSVKYFMGEDVHNLTQLFSPVTMLAEWFKMMTNNWGTNSDNIQWPQSKSWMSPSYLGMPQKIVNVP